MKEVLLTKGLKALVDDEDFQKVNAFKWCASKCCNMWYAMRGETRNGKRRTIYMHRFIMNALPNTEIDHRDNNTMNNQKSNLRFCTRSQNLMNARIRSDNVSGYKGVIWIKRSRKWMAYMRRNGHMKYIGLFNSAADAARAYDSQAIDFNEIFAKTNRQLKQGRCNA